MDILSTEVGGIALETWLERHAEARGEDEEDEGRKKKGNKERCCNSSRRAVNTPGFYSIKCQTRSLDARRVVDASNHVTELFYLFGG